MNEKATSEMDYGYDSLNIDDFPNDIYLLNGENQLVIEGKSRFRRKKVKLLIDKLESFDSAKAIYIYDDLTGIYHDIRNETLK
ncbi:hypothetical protein [Flavobacterium sp. LB1P71]|uniref:hypothetical protein n=1 Tax=unclassified Flavobacterium TaxID=196869 RepID=UPI003AAE8FE1